MKCPHCGASGTHAPIWQDEDFYMCPDCGTGYKLSHVTEAGQDDRIVALAQEAARIADALGRITSILEEMVDAQDQTDTESERKQDNAQLS